jgi:hypothetical protein
MSTQEFINEFISRGFSAPVNEWDTTYGLHKDGFSVYIYYGVNEDEWTQDVGYSAYYNPSSKEEFYEDECEDHTPEGILNWMTNFVPKRIELKEVSVTVNMQVDKSLNQDELNKRVSELLTGRFFGVVVS